MYKIGQTVILSEQIEIKKGITNKTKAVKGDIGVVTAKGILLTTGKAKGEFIDIRNDICGVDLEQVVRFLAKNIKYSILDGEFDKNKDNIVEELEKIMLKDLHFLLNN